MVDESAETLVGAMLRNVRVLAPLGRGGMGEVYEGVDETLGRHVALKVLRADRRLSAAATARFRREARLLSRLEHPNICRIYDFIEGDELDVIVLELVHGHNLAELVRGGLEPQQCRSIADQIARALVAAHALSIVHRDLKPENVMVTPEGEVKVLDFGIARSTETTTDEIDPPAGNAEALRDGAGVTTIGDVIGTPGFMSPEQARGEPVTAASDMYSFGLLLGQLFTGRHPFGEGLPPEVLLQKAMWADTIQPHGIHPRLAALVRRLTALEPPARPTATEAATELERIWEAPRRRLRRLAAVGVAAALVAAAAASTAGFIMARRAQIRAEESERDARSAQEQAQTVTAFLSDLLASPDPYRSGIDVRVVDVLDRAAAALDDRFATSPLVRATIEETLGRTYRGLGQYEPAIRLLGDAVGRRASILGADDPATLAARHHLGEAQYEGSQLDDAEATLLATLEARRRTLGEDDPATLDSLALSGEVLRGQRRFDEADVVLRDAYERRRSVLGEVDATTLESLHRLGVIHTDFRRWDEAAAALATCLEQRAAVLGELHPDTISTVHAQGVLAARQGSNVEAESLFRKVVDMQTRATSSEHPRTLFAAHNVAVVVRVQGRLDEAIALDSELLATARRVLPEGHRYTMDIMGELAGALEGAGRAPEADALLRERWTIARGLYGDEHRITLETMSRYANYLAARERWAEAEVLFRAALASRRALFGDTHGATVRSLRDLATVVRAQGRTAEADALDAERARAQAVNGRE